MRNSCPSSLQTEGLLLKYGTEELPHKPAAPFHREAPFQETFLEGIILLRPLRRHYRYLLRRKGVVINADILKRAFEVIRRRGTA